MAQKEKTIVLKDIRQMMSFRNHGVRNLGMIETDESIRPKDYNPVVARARTFTLNDYNWSEEFSLESKSADTNRTIPKLILTEFQPEKSFNFDEATKAIGTKIASLAEKAKKSALGRGLVSAGATAAQRAAFTLNAIPGSKDATTGVAMTFVRKLMQGQYLNVYEIPFFGDDYLVADSKDGWSESGSEKMLGKEANTTLKEDFSINFPMAPQWSKGDSGNKVNWSNSFHLINDTTTNLLRNFQFLNALTSGNYWMQLGFIQQSPNVFDVHCPGRFHQYYSALGVKVYYKGKNRENREASVQLAKMGYKGFASGDNAVLFPDAFEIKIESKDLTPNNFNTYMDNMIGHEKITVGDQRDRIGVKDIYDAYAALEDQIQDAALNKAGSVLNSTLKALNPFD